MPEEPRVFTYEQALETFPRVRELTATAVRQVETLFNRVQSRDELERRQEEIEDEVGTVIQAWARRVSSLGCHVKGLWLVDWDNGSGYYCWRYPEESIAFFHTYDDGYPGRIPIN